MNGQNHELLEKCYDVVTTTIDDQIRHGKSLNRDETLKFVKLLSFISLVINVVSKYPHLKNSPRERVVGHFVSSARSYLYKKNTSISRIVRYKPGCTLFLDSLEKKYGNQKLTVTISNTSQSVTKRAREDDEDHRDTKRVRSHPPETIQPVWPAPAYHVQEPIPRIYPVQPGYPAYHPAASYSVPPGYVIQSYYPDVSGHPSQAGCPSASSYPSTSSYPAPSYRDSHDSNYDNFRFYEDSR